MLSFVQTLILAHTCRPWEFDLETAGQSRGYRRKLKGHKHDKLAAARFAVMELSFCLVPADETPRQAEHEHFCCASRQEDIKKNLEGMDARIQAYRVSTTFGVMICSAADVLQLMFCS